MRAIITALLLLPSLAHAESGIASIYAVRDNPGTRTASGIPLNNNALTAAHKTLPFRSKHRVTYQGRSVVVMITDRGPFIRGRIIDLTPAAARAIGLPGLGRVTVEAAR